MITLDGIILPSGLEWVDEYTWSPVSQTIKKSLTGALIIPERALLSGREITLEGDDQEWITKANLELLRAKADTPNLTMTLDLHGTSYNVRFLRGQSPIEARLIVPFEDPQEDDVYSITVRLMQV